MLFPEPVRLWVAEFPHFRIKRKELFGGIDFKVDLKDGELPKDIRAVLVKSKVKRVATRLFAEAVRGRKGRLWQIGEESCCVSGRCR